MKPTEELMQEHNTILQMLTILERTCGMLDTGFEIDAHDLQKMLEFLKVFGDGCHHAKEEQGLFPALEQSGIPRDHGPIGIMLAEHDLGRKYFRGMSDALKESLAGNKPWHRSGVFSKNARAYAILLRAHIEKENKILFPMADVALTKERQTELSREFKRFELERIGPEKHEALHALLQDLKAAYLPKSDPIEPRAQ